jgi:hypothetical protein
VNENKLLPLHFSLVCYPKLSGNCISALNIIEFVIQYLVIAGLIDGGGITNSAQPPLPVTRLE